VDGRWLSGVLPELRRRLGLAGVRTRAVLEPAGRVPRRVYVLGGVAVMVLLVALAAYGRLGPEDAAPADQFIDFKCQACDQSFSCSHREFEKLWDRREFQRDDSGRVLRFKCRHCGKIAAIRPDPHPPASVAPPKEQPPAE